MLGEAQDDVRLRRHHAMELRRPSGDEQERNAVVAPVGEEPLELVQDLVGRAVEARLLDHDPGVPEGVEQLEHLGLRELIGPRVAEDDVVGAVPLLVQVVNERGRVLDQDAVLVLAHGVEDNDAVPERAPLALRIPGDELTDETRLALALLPQDDDDCLPSHARP